MSETKKKKATSEKATKTKATADPAAPTVPKAAKAPKAKPEKAPKEPLVVFAIRLTEAERNTIHEAAGPRNATRFVRAVALAAAREDDAAFQQAIADARALRV